MVHGTSSVAGGKTAGVAMRIVSAKSAQMIRLAHHPVPSQPLSKEARVRLQWFTWHDQHGQNVSLTCRHFGISRQTFYVWRKRYRPRRLASLEQRSSRPRRRRQPTWTVEQVHAVQQLRAQYPRWGKDKLVHLLPAGMRLSVSMVGRILRSLKRRGALVEPLRRPISVHKRRPQRPYAIRKPPGYVIAGPGDLVQLDTVDVRPVPGALWARCSSTSPRTTW